VIRAVIFDLFGTLIANYGREHYLEVIENMGRAVDAPPDAFRDLRRKHYVDRLTGVHKTESDNISWVCDQLGVHPNDAQVAASNEIYLEFARPFLMNARDSSKDVLREIQTAAIKTGLISDCGPWVPDNWASSPFAGLIDFPVYSSRCGAKKPENPCMRKLLPGWAYNLKIVSTSPTETVRNYTRQKLLAWEP